MTIIDSNAPASKNQLTTGTLTWENQQNKADYKTSGAGVSYAGKDAPLNAKGLTPSIAPTVKGNADSTTKSAVAEGTVTITNTKDQKQNVSDLNRDTKNTLNKLHEIFDKDKVQEKQEFIGLLTKDVNEAIHKVADKNNWADGSKEKTALHALASGILAEMGGAGLNSGALAGGVNEYVIGYLTKTKGEAWMVEHPDEVQWLSTIIGGAVNQAISGDISTGAGSALSGTKWNYYLNRSQTFIFKSLIDATLKDKNGNNIGMNSTDEVYDLISRIIYEEDPYGSDDPYQFYRISEKGLNRMEDSLIKHGYSVDSVKEFIELYKNIESENIGHFRSESNAINNPLNNIFESNQSETLGDILTWGDPESNNFIPKTESSKIPGKISHILDIGKFINSKDKFETGAGLVGNYVGTQFGSTVIVWWSTEKSLQNLQG